MFINGVLNFRAANPWSSAATVAAAPRRQIGDERLAGAVTGLAALAPLAIAIAFPAAYFISAYDRLIGEIEARAEVYAGDVSGAAAESPELFNAFLGTAEIDLTGLAIAAEDDPQLTAHPPETRRVFAADGHLILDVPARQPLAWPTVSQRMPVTQTGNRLGEIEIIGSLRPQLLVTLAVAAGSFTFGALLLMVLRVIPLRLMRDALDRASFLSLHDQLTGLPNQSLLADRLEQALSSSRRDGARVAMLCIDLDHFKEVNDTLGHAAGDELLRTIVGRLSACLRAPDTLARIGGDEFVVVAPAVDKPLDAAALATRFIEAARDPVTLDGQQVFIGMSVGIAFSTPALDASELRKQADVALYQAKAAGRGGYCFLRQR
jgi:diguanylate cyclase (GGDEF)-like protein